MTYTLAGYNQQTGLWDILDRNVPHEEALVLKKQIVESTRYTMVNIISEEGMDAR